MRIVSLLVCVTVVVGCGSAPATAESPTPSAARSTPDVGCGDIGAACADAARAALVATRRLPGVPIRVQLGRGVYCPTPGLLFANTSCPGGGLPPAAGGEWIGHALVTFALSPRQGYLNLADEPTGLRAVLIATATPPPSAGPS
jgi:hypothetical protein